MSNATTKAQREKWIARASEIIQMDDDTRMTNFYEARDQLVSELGISQQSATTALAHAARRYRSKLFSPTAAAVSLGSVTSKRKAAAARENGRKGGRPRKYQGDDTMADRTQNKMEIKFAAAWVKRACADYGIKATWFRVLNYDTDAKGDLVEVGNTKRAKVLTSGDRSAYSM